MTESSFAWLHLTDLHVGQPREAGRLPNLECAFLEDLERVVPALNEPTRVVFFSGDLVFRGTNEEFVRATAVLGRLLTRLHELNRKIDAEAPPPVLFPVPGNHDLVRPAPAEAERIRGAFAGRGPTSPDLLGPGQAPARKLVDAAFAPYRAWLSQGLLPFPPDGRDGLLPGDRVAPVSRGGVSVGIVGLNSTCLHLGDVGPGTQHLDLLQMTSLLGEQPEDWFAEHHFHVLVTHHPPSWLTEAARTTLSEEIRRGSRFDLHLYGHAHDGRHEVDPGTTGTRHLVEGRSLFGADTDTQRIHGYSIGRFVLGAPEADGQRPKRVETWNRQGWQSHQGWRFGPMDERQGAWRLLIDVGRTDLPSVGDSESPDFIEGLGRSPRGGSARWSRWSDPSELKLALEALAPGRKWILLLASVPELPTDPHRAAKEARFVETARPDAIRAFVEELGSQVAARDGKVGLLFGGHPTITHILAPMALVRADTPWLALLQDQSFQSTFPQAVNVLAHASGVWSFLMEPGTGPDLPRLRQALFAPNLLAAVFVGGKSGILEEFRLAGERPDLPRFAVGLGGGAAAALALEHPVAALGATATHPEPRVTPAGRLWHTPKMAVDAILEAVLQD
jgi:hypothetical protein